MAMGDTIIIINPGQMFVKFSGYFRVKGAWAMCQVGCRCVKSVTPHLHGLLLSLKQMLMVPDGAYCLFGNFINQHGKQLEPCLLHIDICNIYIYLHIYIYRYTNDNEPFFQACSGVLPTRDQYIAIVTNQSSPRAINLKVLLHS